MKQSRILFFISTIILLGYLVGKQMGWTDEITGYVPDAKSARETEKLLAMPVCENEADFKAVRPFDVMRAYPKRALRRGLEARVTADLRIDDKGRVVDVIILKNDSHPSFSQAVERGALRMVYERAEPACKGKLRERTLLAEFRLYDEVKEKPKQRVSP